MLDADELLALARVNKRWKALISERYDDTLWKRIYANHFGSGYNNCELNADTFRFLTGANNANFAFIGAKALAKHPERSCVGT